MTSQNYNIDTYENKADSELENIIKQGQIELLEKLPTLQLGLSCHFCRLSVWCSSWGWCNEMTGVKVDNKVKFKVNRNIRYTPSLSPSNCVTISDCHVVFWHRDSHCVIEQQPRTHPRPPSSLIISTDPSLSLPGRGQQYSAVEEIYFMLWIQLTSHISHCIVLLKYNICMYNTYLEINKEFFREALI